ncbi:unnamed protein product [Brassica rapa subsp. narinosa]
MLLAETCAHAGCISSANLKYYGESEFHQDSTRRSVVIIIQVGPNGASAEWT